MSTMSISANRLEILQIADSVAREKSIDKEIVIQAMEHALQKAARSRAAADRIRPHRRANGQAGHRAEVREAERDRQYGEYKDRIGEIVNGVVKRVEYGNVIVDLGRGEGMIRRDEMIPRENVPPGDRVRAYVYDVRREPGPQIFLSRTHPQFMAKLFAQEVPESTTA
jgi:hypothetical protein